MRYLFIVLSILLFPLSPAQAEVSVGIGVSVPGVSIGINLPAYPRLVRVPGHPVYYDPRLDSNYFFYDGLYWVLYGDNWYVSSWYNGPWDLVERDYVPLYVLSIPVRYYRKPPPYFRGWRPEAPPHWHEHWGRDWEKHRSEWDRRDRRAVPPPAPLPSYQRQYAGERYPRAMEQQRSIRTERYRYQPREAVTQKYYERQRYQDGPQGDDRRNRHEDRSQDRR